MGKPKSSLAKYSVEFNNFAKNWGKNMDFQVVQYKKMEKGSHVEFD